MILLCGSDNRNGYQIREAPAELEMYTETAPLGTEPGNVIQEHVLN